MHAHAHPHVPAGPAADRGEWRLVVVLGLTTLYLLAEVSGGLLTGSLALLADSGHLLGDVLALGMAVAAMRFARRPATAGKTYGFYRAEVLSALINSVVLLLVAIWVLYAAWERLSHPLPAVEAVPMMLVAFGGLLVTLIGVALLHSQAAESLNVRGAFLEVLGDLFGSLGTLLAGAVILLTGFVAADALVSALIGLLIVPRAWALLHSVVDVLLEATPRNIDSRAIEAALRNDVPGVAAVHDLHIWTISSGFVAMSAHLQSSGRASADVLHDAQRLLRERFAIEHATLQVEATDHADDGACCVADPRCFVPTAVPLPATRARSRTMPRA